MWREHKAITFQSNYLKELFVIGLKSTEVAWWSMRLVGEASFIFCSPLFRGSSTDLWYHPPKYFLQGLVLCCFKRKQKANILALFPMLRWNTLAKATEGQKEFILTFNPGLRFISSGKSRQGLEQPATSPHSQQRWETDTPVLAAC